VRAGDRTLRRTPVAGPYLPAVSNTRVNDITVWVIAMGFYAPVHYLGPALVALMSGSEESWQRRKLLKRIAVDCTLSMAAAFAIAVPLFKVAPQYAAMVFLLAMAVPYVHIWVYRKRAL
jgi:hypothetical protein